MTYRVQTIGFIEETIAPSFTLPSAHDGKPVSLYSFRQRQPVALLFVPWSADVPLVLAQVEALLPGFRDAGAAVLLVTHEPITGAPAVPLVLIDRDGQVFRLYECHSQSDLCLFGLDRYGAVIHQSASRVEQLEASLRALLDAIEFSERQCPE